jgi:hypothetical protein
VRSFPALAAMLGNHLTEYRTDLTSRPLRFWFVRDYLIAYAPDEKRLWVGCRATWQPKSARHGRDSQRQRVKAVDDGTILPAWSAVPAMRPAPTHTAIVSRPVFR